MKYFKNRRELKIIADHLYIDVRWHHSNKKISDMVLNKLYGAFKR